MLRYPISTLLYLAKINIKDKIQDALKLHNNIDVKLTITIKDKDGKIIKQHKQRSHSFVSNFLTMLANLMLNTNGEYNNYYYFVATTGQWWSYDGAYTIVNNTLNILDVANDSTYGIVVGTGTTPPTPKDYILGNQIVNGTGNGQLVYGAHSVTPASGTSGIQAGTSQPSTGVLTPSGNTTSFQISRTFTNQSGASITVSEVGIIAKVIGEGDNTITVLIIHDLLSSAITIPNGGVMGITYTISVTT